jgi:membrane peptidoglycan carboxypeptidase
MTATNGDQAIKYNQTETMASALAKSSNTYFVGLEDSLFGCDLSPILSTMTRLGMKNIAQKDPNDKTGKATVGNTIVRTSQPTLTLGQLPTSPLELTSAYAAAANDGTYCTPAPVTSITDKSGNPVQLKRSPCTQAMTPQVARTVTSMLTGDTLAGGTSANIFKNWYTGANKSLIAGKTGTDTVQPDPKSPTELNTSFWFVGMTNKLVATMALINVSTPLAPLSGLPGIPDATARTTADGSVAAGYWYTALAPTITAGKWSWPAPAGVAGSVAVPNVVGQSPQVATQLLTQKGFKVSLFGQTATNTGGTPCAAAAQLGTVGYYGPATAAPGTTITYCVSTGLKPYVYTPPPATSKATTATPGAPASPVVPPAH